MAHVATAGERPVLITSVGESPQEEYERRRKRYGAMMLGRVVCVVAAFVVGSLLHAIWLSLLLIIGAAILPWAAVLIANDRLPKAERVKMAQARGIAPTVTATALSASAAPDPAGGQPPAGERQAPRVIDAAPASTTTSTATGGAKMER